MTDRPKLLDFTKLPRRVLWCFGFYFGDDMEEHIFHRLICIISLTLTIPFPVMIMGKILLDLRHDLQALLETLHYFFLHFWIVVKIMLFLYGFRRLRNLEAWLQTEIFNSYTRRQDHFLNKAMRKQMSFFKLLWSSTLCFTSMFALFLPKDKVSLNIPIWMPFKMDRIFWHIYEVLCYVITASTYPAIDCIITGLVANMTAQLQILGDNLERIHLDHEGGLLKCEDKIQERFKRFIQHHIAILQFINETEAVFSYSLFCQILFSVLGICLSGFQFLLVPPGNTKFMLACGYLTVMFFQIYFTCWFVEDLIIQGSDVVTSCYASEWYNYGSTTKKLLFILMERAKKPISFRAGYFFTLSLATFVMILRNSYSYFAILRHVYKE
uniref:Odorant receptor n=2 Tax=Scarabaeidae TaxID=7055 RepID=A0A0E3Y6Q3_9SCAR|nr:odorant receptor 9 [Anomala corpulenta]